jgi:hypothetical protein
LNKPLALVTAVALSIGGNFPSHAQTLTQEQWNDAMDARASSLLLEPQAERHIWRSAAWSDNGGVVAAITTDVSSRNIRLPYLAVRCTFLREQLQLHLELYYHIPEMGWYSLDLAGSSPESRPTSAALMIDGEVYDNTQIHRDTDGYRDYRNHLYKALSQSKSAYIDITFRDEYASMGTLTARFSNFEKDAALEPVNRLCPYD